MLEQTARVVAVHAAGVEVCARPSAGCARCERGQGCGGGLISALLQRGERTLIARVGPVPVGVGDVVTLRLRAGVLLEAAVLAYLVPLVAMFVALALAGALLAAPAEATMAVVAVAGLAGGAWGTRRYLRTAGRRRWQPLAVARGPAGPEPGPTR